MRDHKKLKAFELADQIVINVYKMTANCPKEELFGLTSQIRPAAISVPSNIVEGCSLDSKEDYLRFLLIAFGSLKELHYQIELSNRLGFLDVEHFHDIKPKLIEVEKTLNGLIRSLRKPITKK